MAKIQPLREEPETPPRPHRVPSSLAPRVGRADVKITTPSHTPGTQKGEEVSARSPEKGRPGKARQARSATSINPKMHGPIDPRMPHLPPA